MSESLQFRLLVSYHAAVNFNGVNGWLLGKRVPSSAELLDGSKLLAGSPADRCCIASIVKRTLGLPTPLGQGVTTGSVVAFAERRRVAKGDSAAIHEEMFLGQRKPVQEYPHETSVTVPYCTSD